MTLGSYHRSDPLSRLEALEKAATPVPWEFNDSTDVRGQKGEFRAPSPYNGFMLVGPWTNDADAALIAEARNLLPALIEVAKAAQRYREIGLSDPTSLDLPPAGAALDRALALLDEGDAR